MLFCPVSSNILSLPSTSSPVQTLGVVIVNPKFHYFTRFSAQRLKVHCCHRTIQLENESREKSNFIKKKRKLRPSFVEQVQSKWSVKIPSLRENFPWEALQGGDKDKESEEERPEIDEDGSSVKEREKCRISTEAVSSDVKRNTFTAPWARGSALKKKTINSEGLGKSEERIPKVDQHFDEGRELLEKVVVVSHVESEEKCEKFDAITMKPSDTNEISKATRIKDGISLKDSLTNFQEDVNKKYSRVSKDLGRLPWESKAGDGFVKSDKSTNGNTVLAEKIIPESELKRLRNVSLRMVERIKVGAAGVTQDLVNSIHEKWKNDEVVKLKFEGPPSKNMKRTHEILECRTGGLVIYRAGSLIVLYRGMTYKLNCVKSYNEQGEAYSGMISSSQDLVEDSPQRVKVRHLNEASESESSRTFRSDYFGRLSEEEQINLSELNYLLDELGPRFTDWSRREPVPVDADLLPAVIHGFKTPFRLLPHGFKQALSNKEMTFLRRTARTLPPHFALGRNRELQGLAHAMVKLWENSAIAKIAIKRGVQNTSNERMAEELKILTGGTLISRNKEYIVFYRGNDFLPPNISSTLIEAERSAGLRQAEEELARQRSSTLIDTKSKESKPPLVAGTLAETVAASSRWASKPTSEGTEKMLRETARAKHASLVNSLERKLAIAKDKIRRAERALAKVLENQEPGDLPTDLETLTDEERFLFRKMGLSMKPYLELGRREVFSGTIENMHLHWKHRELVKILVERKNLPQVKHVAVSLEAESGGVLVSVDKTVKGHVIIIYRGKNYRPPIAFRPRNLLTKRQALARSIELQRREALKHHIRELEEKVEKLKLGPEDMMPANDAEVKEALTE